MKEPSAQVQHATNDFCIAPRLAESGAHSMDGLITLDFLMKEASAQVQHATNDFCIAPRLAESGAHSMDDLITLDFLMKEASAQVQHATNDFCIAPRLAESGAHSMDDLITLDFSIKEPSAQVQHATNDFCIALRLAESGAQSMDGLISPDFLLIAIFHGPKCITTGSKWAKNTCLCIQNGLGSLLEKRVFDPFWIHFWSHNGPFSRHCGIFHGPKRVTTGSKRAKNTCLSIPSGLGTSLEKMIFFAPGAPVDPPLAPTVRGPG